MGFNIRRSKKLFPGVRLNLSKNGLGVSIGPAHSKVSFSPKGRVTGNLGLPGTGIRYTKRLDLKVKPEAQSPTPHHSEPAVASETPQKEATRPAEAFGIPVDSNISPESQASLETEPGAAMATSASLNSPTSRASGEPTINGKPYGILIPEKLSKYFLAGADTLKPLVTGKLLDMEELKAKVVRGEIGPETQIIDSYTGARVSAKELLGSYLF